MGTATTTTEWITAIAACVAALFGGGSLLIAFGILLRDRGRARAAQASQVACWRRWPETTHLGSPVVEDPNEPGHLLIDATDSKVTIETDEVHLHNASDRPITDVGIRSRKMSKPELRKMLDPRRVAEYAHPFTDATDGFSNTMLEPSEPAYTGAMMPGETAVRDMAEIHAENPPQYYRRWVLFRDVNGVAWVRDLADGRLMRRDGLRARYRFRRGWWWTTRRGVARQSYRWWVDG